MCLIRLARLSSDSSDGQGQRVKRPAKLPIKPRSDDIRYDIENAQVCCDDIDTLRGQTPRSSAKCLILRPEQMEKVSWVIGSKRRMPVLTCGNPWSLRTYNADLAKDLIICRTS